MFGKKVVKVRVEDLERLAGVYEATAAGATVYTEEDKALLRRLRAWMATRRYGGRL